MNRDSMVFYESFYSVGCDLPEADKWKLFEAIFQYGFYGIEIKLDGVPATLFKLILPQLQANNRKFLNGHKGGEHGAKGGRPRKNPSGVIEGNPKGVLNETPNDNVNDNEKVNEIISFLNSKCNTNYKPSTQGNRSPINARLNEGHTVEDLKAVIASKCAEWKGKPQWEQYLRPKTLFAPSNFEGYLQAARGGTQIQTKNTEVSWS